MVWAHRLGEEGSGYLDTDYAPTYIPVHTARAVWIMPHDPDPGILGAHLKLRCFKIPIFLLIIILVKEDPFSHENCTGRVVGVLCNQYLSKR